MTDDFSRVGKLHAISVNTTHDGEGSNTTGEAVSGLIGTIFLKYHAAAAVETTVQIFWELLDGSHALLATIRGNHNRTIAIGIEQISSVSSTQGGGSAIIIGKLLLKVTGTGGTYLRAVTAYVVTMSSTTNVAPMLFANDLIIDEDTSGVIVLNYRDFDGDPPNWSTLKLEKSAEYCTIQLNTPQAGQITVIPEPNFAGLDGISVTVEDNQGNVSNAQFISILVNEVNDAPILDPGNLETDEDVSVDYSIIRLFRDVDLHDKPNWATLELVTAPGNGALKLNTPEPGFVRYTPLQDVHGTDSFSLRVQDSNGTWSNTATFRITVNPVNDAPVLTDAGFPTNEDTPYDYDVQAIYSDVDGDPADWATLEITTAPTKGTLQLNTPAPGKIRYSPNRNENGTDAFKLRVQDVNGAWSNIATLNIVINALADNPVLTNSSLLTLEDAAATLDLNTLYTSPEAAALDRRTIVITQLPTNGTAKVNDTTGILTYTPRANYHGADLIKWTVRDVGGQISNEATILVTVTPVPEHPIVFSYSTDTFENQPITIHPAELRLGFDEDGSVDWRTVKIIATPAHGLVTEDAASGAMTFTPALNNRTPITFRWRVKDNEGNSSADGVVNINILESWIVQAIKAHLPSDYRRLNELSGTFTDSSGNGRQAANKIGSGNISYNSAKAPDGAPAVEITAADQYIDITDPASKAVFSGNQWTVLLFFASKSFNWNDGQQRVAWQFWERDPQMHQVYQAQSPSGKWQSSVRNNGNTQSDETAAIAGGDRNWHSSAIVFNGTDATNTLRYYWDGAESGSDSSTVDPAVRGSTSLRIGNSANSWVGGLAAHWAIWNKALPASAIAAISNPKPAHHSTLRALGNRQKTLLGVAVANNYDAQPAEYRRIAATEFSVLGTENAPKYSTLYATGNIINGAPSGKNNPNWTPMLQFVRACVANNQLQALHCLFWHSDGKVTWLQNEPKTPQNARDLIERRVAELRRWYDTNRFPEPFTIDVCNEMITMNGNEATQGRPLRTDFVWSQMYGSGTGTQISTRQWLIDCYRITRRYFPNSLLIIADYHNEKKGYWKGDAFYNLVVSLLNAGVEIDGVHFQGHFDLKTPNPWKFDASQTVEQINRFKALKNVRGEPLYVGFSELDIKLSGGSIAEQETMWYAIFKTVSHLVDYMGIWGVDDGHSWLNDNGINQLGTLYSATYAKKPAWYQAAQGLWDAQ
jgi:GH35 family endo-1,4-beta-xylanase